MSGAERNKPCPCGSGKKFKHCYQRSDLGCSFYVEDLKKKMLSDHPLKDKEVFEFLNEVINDIGSAFLINPDTGWAYVSPRVQLICIFTLIDVLASYWYEYQGKNDKPGERFLTWCKKYCFTEDNPALNSELKRADAEGLCSFRNSMVHFFGMSASEQGYSFVITPEGYREDEAKEMVRKVRNKGVSLIQLRPQDLHNLIREGGILMLNEMAEVIHSSHISEDKKWQYIEGINRIFMKIRKEGAKKMKFQE